MSLLVPNIGEQEMLNRILGKTTSTDLKLHLFTNDVTPDEADTVATYTESEAAGYEEITLESATWSVATDDGTTTASYPLQIFIYTEGETVYGYYVTDLAGTTLLWAEAFAEAITIPGIGGGIIVRPTITAD